MTTDDREVTQPTTGSVAEPVNDHVTFSSSTVRGLLELSRELAELDDLSMILTRIARGITEIADFEAAVLNMVIEDGDLKATAVYGPDELEDRLLGTVGPRTEWDRILERGKRRAGVIFDIENLSSSTFTHRWTSSDEAWFDRNAGHPQAWLPEYALYVPLHDVHHHLIGVVSVDMPRSGLIPGDDQLATLELLARQAEQAITASQAQARSMLDEHTLTSLFEVSRSPLAICDSNGVFVGANRAFRSVFGTVPHAAALDVNTQAIESTDGFQGLDQAVRDRFEGQLGDLQFAIAVGDGAEAHWYDVVVRGVAYNDAAPQRVVCTFTDVTAERRLRQQYERDAARDPLTGLLNRRGFAKAVTEMLAGAQSGSHIAVLFSDLDDFKLANDVYGHTYGDDVLIQIATQLRALIPDEALVARVGGDEFVVVAECPTPADAELLAETIVTGVVVPAPSDAGRPVRVSVGLATDDAAATRTLDALVQRADRALYRAKAQPGSRWVRADS